MQHGQELKIIMLSEKKKAKNKRIHIIWFHLYKILDNPN